MRPEFFCGLRDSVWGVRMPCGAVVVRATLRASFWMQLGGTMMNGRALRSGWSMGVAVALVLVALGVRAAEDTAAKSETLFREGVDLYQQGRYTDSQFKLRELMSLEPRKELAARLVKEAGEPLFARMMAEPRMGNAPTRLWDLYRKYYISNLADGERMAKMAARVVDPATSEDERVMLYREFGELGHYAIPFLTPYLKDAQHEDFRTYARITISRMGRVAVLAILPLLEHKDELMRANAAFTLGDIEPGDVRAIPCLKARLENTGETPTVKKAVANTLAKITGLPTESLKPAAQYYFDSANRYYLETAGVSDEAESVDGYTWHLNEKGDLIPVLFPIWAWNEQMAEEMVLKGVTLYPDQSAFFPLAACIWAAQYQEVEAMVNVINEQPAKHFYSEEERMTVLAWQKKMVDCRNLVSLCGRGNVNAALCKTLSDMGQYPGHGKLGDVGVFLARALRDLDPLGMLLAAPAPVIEAASAAVPNAAPVLTSIEVVPPLAKVEPSATVQFKAIPKDQFGQPMQGVQIVWEATGGGTIDQTGLFKADEALGRFPVMATAADVAGVLTGTKTVASAEVVPACVACSTCHGSSLVAALDCADHAVQYEAALALAAINKFPDPWMGQEKVAVLLGRGVSENKPIWVLVIDENQNVRNELRMRMEGLGFGVTDAVNGRDGLAKSRAYPPKDVILVADNLRVDLSGQQVLEELQADIRTRYVPVAIIHNRDARTGTQARYGTSMPLVEREMDGDGLQNAIRKLDESKPAEALPKKEAHETAVRCATALSLLDPRWTLLSLNDAVPFACDALVNRKDDVRVPVATFLGKVAGGPQKDKVAERLLEIMLKQENAVEMRLAAAVALGKVAPEKFADDYVKAQFDKEHIVQEANAVNFGVAVRENQKIVEALLAKRIDKDQKEK